MTNQPCSTESLASSGYCRLTVCMECGVINLSLPSRITLQFEIHQFLEIASAFNRAAQILKAKTEPKQNAKVIKLKQIH